MDSLFKTEKMKSKKILFLLAVLFLMLNAGKTTAQEKTNNAEVLDSVQFRVLYEFSQQADKQREKTILTDTMALLVGANWSEYYDWHKTKLDSLEQLISEQLDIIFWVVNDDELNTRLEAGAEVYNTPRKPETSRVYKERMKQKIITFDDGPFERGVGSTYLVLDENVPPMDWVISSDTATVLGYLCTKASTTFRGRTYDAWFSPEIPASEGPWKLYGLPGLILKAETTDGIFRFRTIGLQTITNKGIAFPDDRKNVPAKDIKQLNDFRKNKRRQINVILGKDKNTTGYLTANPVTYQNLEIGN